MIVARLVPLLLLPALLVGCASGGLGGGSDDAGQVEKLRRELVAERQRTTMAEVEVRRLRERVAELESRLDETPPARGASEPVSVPAPTRVEAEDLVPVEPPRPVGREPIEETELEVPPVGATPSAEEPFGEEFADEFEDELEEPSTEETPSPEGEAAQALYDRGYAAFHQKRYAEAESAFRRVLELHAEHPLADNAQFWIGESRYARGDFASALAAFSATVERYPEGNKVADAMLKAGKCLEAMGQRDDAIATYRAIRERFPGTVVASEATARLGALGADRGF